MKKIALLFLLNCFTLAFTQQWEIGTYVGVNSTNILDSRVWEEKAVIGKSIWNVPFGVSVWYFFSNPYEIYASGIRLNAEQLKRGSKSGIDSESKYELNTFSIDAMYRGTGKIRRGWKWYFDIGLSYSFLETENAFTTKYLSELQAFPDITNNLDFKENEFSLVYGLGFEKKLTENWFAFAEGKGHAAITEINSNNGSYRSQSLGCAVGIKYVLYKKPKQNP